MATELYVIFDGPPSHEAPRFVELEDAAGKGHGQGVGAWWERTQGGYFKLGPFYTAQQADAEMKPVREQNKELLAALDDISSMADVEDANRAALAAIEKATA